MHTREFHITSYDFMDKTAMTTALIVIPDAFTPEHSRRSWLDVHMARVDAAVGRYASRQPYYGRPLPRLLTADELEKLKWNNWM